MKSHDLALPLVRRIAQRGFAAHRGAARFQRQREMQNADLVLGESRRRVVLASRSLATCAHGRKGAIGLGNNT